ncbi:MAG: hypothetical protein ABI629_23320 [bacterium]
MDDLRFEESEFTVGWCAACDRDVLTYADVDEASEAAPRCVHCEQRVGRLRTATGEDLPQHGYGVLEDAGCGRPDCGNGRCGRNESH